MENREYMSPTIASVWPTMQALAVWNAIAAVTIVAAVLTCGVLLKNSYIQ